MSKQNYFRSSVKKCLISNKGSPTKPSKEWIRKWVQIVFWKNFNSAIEESVQKVSLDRTDEKKPDFSLDNTNGVIPIQTYLKSAGLFFRVTAQGLFQQ